MDSVQPSYRDLDGNDPYQVLSVAPNATRAEILAAHRRLVQLIHPDRQGGDEYETKLLHVARDLLLNPESRAAYDASQQAPEPEPEPSPWDYDYATYDANPKPEPSPWDSDVIMGVPPEPAPQPPRHWSPPYSYEPPTWRQPPANYGGHVPVQPYWQAPPVHRPSTGVRGQSIIALVITLTCCAPLGAVLGFISLRSATGRSDRTVALIATIIGTICSFILILYFALAALAG